MTTSPADNDNTGKLGSAHRKLSDEVLQTAEEAVLATPPAQSAEPAGDRALLRYQGAVARYVAQKPCQSALIAAVAGAVAAAVLRSALRRSRR